MSHQLAQIAVDNFVLQEGKLYRLQATGDLRRVLALDNKNLPADSLPSVISCNTGSLVATVAGRRLRAVDIAWTLHYGSWPLYPLVVADGDPHNMVQSNLLAVRGQKYRPRITVSGKFFVHNLAAERFSSPELARDDWRRCAAALYRADQSHVLFAEQVNRERAIVTAERVAKPVRARVKVDPNKPRRPAPIKGKEWHYWKGAWVSVPVACHVSDDYMVRIEAVLAGAKSFVYDEEQQRTLAIY